MKAFFRRILIRLGFPVPPYYDYQGYERNRGYIRGITSVRCTLCRSTGFIDGSPIFYRTNGVIVNCCPNCGGYGDVPREP